MEQWNRTENPEKIMCICNCFLDLTQIPRTYNEEMNSSIKLCCENQAFISHYTKKYGKYRSERQETTISEENMGNAS